MAIRSYVLTLNAAAQRLSSVLGDTEVGGPDDHGLRQIILAADPANGNVVYLAGSNIGSEISSTNHGFSLDPTQATAKDRESIGPFDSGAVRLSDLWALGTNAQRLMITVVPF